MSQTTNDIKWHHKIRPEQWCWILAKVSLALLSLFYLSHPEYGPLRQENPYIDAAAYSFVFFGCIMSISGLVARAIYWGERMKKGALVDLIGIMFIACGTSTFVVGRISYALQEDVSVHRAIGGILFGIALTSMFAGRAFLKNSLMREIEK